MTLILIGIRNLFCKQFLLLHIFSVFFNLNVSHYREIFTNPENESILFAIFESKGPIFRDGSIYFNYFFFPFLIFLQNY